MSGEGDLSATVNLGNIYLHGSRHVPMNLPLAIKYLTKAADAGAHAAAGQLGFMYIHGGMGLQRDAALGHKYLRLSLSKSDTMGHLGSGYAYWRGIGVERNVSRAMEHFEKIMTKHADSAFYMAEIIMGSDKHASPAVSPKESDAYGLASVDPPQRRKRLLADVDYMRAAQLYSAASMRGSLLALHR